MSARLAVSGERCTGHGRCYTLATTGWLSPDDEGYVEVKGSAVAVPEGREAEAWDAVSVCPEAAITITEDESGSS
ncbi:ferredoxin [Pseudonocardia xishanensis]|uniref:Ferredoxin n=1 Tax=Pseudonocardia xishanensis TaxID=630995 RepID=A0ABP8RTX9_9PSEU